MCKKIQFTEVFCFQEVTSKKFFNLGLDVRWFVAENRQNAGVM